MWTIVRDLALATTLFTSASIAFARELTFTERVRAQEAIERAYYAHQLHATRSFEEAVPYDVLEKKVRTYLKQSVALAEFWRSPVTAQALRGEANRIARETRMPGMLAELYAALGNDPFLIEECLARPALVDRLSRSFLSADDRAQGAKREEIQEIRQGLMDGRIDPWLAAPRRQVMEAASTRLEMTPEGLRLWRNRHPQRIGEVGPIVDHPDAFFVEVILNEDIDSLVTARYGVSKMSWDEWWTEASYQFSESAAASAAGDTDVLSVPGPVAGLGWEPGAESVGARCPDGLWDNGGLDDFLDPRLGETVIWTGQTMIVWGGSSTTPFSSGSRYDPVIDTWSSMTPVNAPSPRAGHVAVWTGNRMIVWGGSDGTTYLSTGGKYDPVADRWEPITSTGAPDGRSGSTAVWTGESMLVWGGVNGSSSSQTFPNTGGRYDPSTDTWRPITTFNAPEGRYRHSAIWTGTRMVVWGGAITPNVFSPIDFRNTGGIYDPVSDTWGSTSLTNVPGARYAHTAVWTGSRMIVWGGVRSNGVATNSGSSFDPVANTWGTLSVINAPEQRASHTATWTGSSMIIWGGGNFGYLKSGGRYDPSTGAWSPIGEVNAPQGRSAHHAVWTGSLMIVWGGLGSSPMNTGGRYDPANASWTPTSRMDVPAERTFHTSVWTGNVMVVWGGQSVGGSPLPAAGGRYNPTLNTWTPVSTAGAPSARVKHTAAWTGHQMVVWGGSQPNSPAPSFYLNTGGRYDPVSDTWAPTSPIGAPSGRDGHTAVWIGDRMIIWGGIDSSSMTLNSGGRYDSREDVWTPVAPAPAGRSGHTTIWTGRTMIVWGGYTSSFSGSMVLNTGARYDPISNSWTSMSSVDAPAARTAYTAVWTGREMVVWGGLRFAAENTGGRYDPEKDQWSPTSIVAAPAPRAGHTAVWTGRSMIIWGGKAPDSVLPMNSGGMYDPIHDSWTPTSSWNAPVARSAHTAEWIGDSMLLWGGAGYSSLPATGGRFFPRCRPPVAIVHATSSMECTAFDGAQVLLNGSESFDLDSAPGTQDDIAAYDWYQDSQPAPRFLGSGSTLSPTLPIGSHTITLKISDFEGNESTATAAISIVDTTGPALSCPALQVLECTSPQGASAQAQAAATDSCSPTVFVTNPRTGGADASGIYPLGTSPLTFTATDESGNVTTCETTVTVQDTTPPLPSVDLDPRTLWPPNHRLMAVEALASASDACSTASIYLASVSSNEPDDALGSGDGSTTDDIRGVESGTTDNHFDLRAERDGAGSGRTYDVVHAARDGSGNETFVHSFVFVPHDLGGVTDPLDPSVIQEAGGTILSWPPVPGAATYDTIRGRTRELRDSGTFIDLGSVTCIRASSPGTGTCGHEDRDTPAAGEAFFYLVAYDDGRNSGYGSASVAKSREATAGGCD